MRGFGFIGAFGFLVLLIVAGVIGFGLGQNTVPAVAPAPGTPVVYYGHGGFLGFGFFGFLLFLFLIFAVIGIFRRAAWGHRGWGHHGNVHGYWGRSWDRQMPPMADEMLDRWHREAHGDKAPTERADNKSDNQPNS